MKCFKLIMNNNYFCAIGLLHLPNLKISKYIWTLIILLVCIFSALILIRKKAKMREVTRKQMSEPIKDAGRFLKDSAS